MNTEEIRNEMAGGITNDDREDLNVFDRIVGSAVESDDHDDDDVEFEVDVETLADGDDDDDDDDNGLAVFQRIILSHI